MVSLFRKEITSFFGSLTGYLIAFVFLVANGLFLWVFPGNFNILDNGYSSLDSYFMLAPWIFLFLVPALTMRLFAEEKRMGTLEVLFTRPLSLFQLVWAKFLAGLVLVLICLLPTLVYFFSVYSLGNPVGNWDGGAAWGSFIGLFFLAAAYVAIGVFSSSLTDNPVFSFIVALFFSYLFYLGVEQFAGLGISVSLSEFFIQLGINEHYLSLSRGVVDSRDVVYYCLLIASFLVLTTVALNFNQKRIKKKLKRLLLLAVSVVLINYIAGYFFFRIDLTSEKRFSLSPVSKEMVAKLDSPVKIDLFLDGELPAGFRKLQRAVKEKVQDFNAYSSMRIRFELHDPYKMTENQEERNKLFDRLISLGLTPTDLRLKKEEGTVTHLIFPGAVVRYKDFELGVNLLKNNPRLPAEVNLNNSIETLEFELVRALKQLIEDERPVVAFLGGQGELGVSMTQDFRNALLENYEVKDVVAPGLLDTTQKPSVLIIADPTTRFEEQDKFYIDQYLMRGGNLLWLVDPVQVSLDSLSRGESTLAFPRDLNLMDQLFRYGVRINPDLLQDVDCLMMPVNTSLDASKPKYTPAPWYYSPLLSPSQDHEISRNLNRVVSEFASSIDTVGGNPNLKKSVILHTSPYSRKLSTPMEVSLQSINNPPARNLFTEHNLPVGVLVEGTFPSVFKNRMVDQFDQAGIEVLGKSAPAKMIVLADGSLIANQLTRKNGKVQPLPLGFDRYSGQTFGNKEFLLNAVNYMCDESGIMSLRSQVFKIRLLDKIKIREQQVLWKSLNVALPILLVLLLGLVFNLVRKHRYTR